MVYTSITSAGLGLVYNKTLESVSYPHYKTPIKPTTAGMADKLIIKPEFMNGRSNRVVNFKFMGNLSMVRAWRG